MAEPNYIGTAGAQIPRNAFALYVSVGTTSAEEWEVLGWGVEESGVSLEIDSETVNDILGNTIVKNNSMTETQTFDPNDIRVGDKLNAKLIQLVRQRNMAGFSQFTVLRVWGFLGTAGQYEAEKDVNCTIKPSGDLGGSGFMSMPIEVTMSGERQFGTTNVFKQTSADKIVFTPKTEE